MSTLTHGSKNEEEIYFNFINSIKSEVTKETYEKNIKSFMKFCNVTKLSDLLLTDTQKQIVKYLMSLREKGLSYNTLSLTLCAIYQAVVNLLKIRWNESLNWESKESFGPNTKIRPVNFSTEHRNMLSNLHAIISKRFLAIEEKHDKLLTSLRTAYAEELNLKKEQTSYDDLLDALRLALKSYNIE